MFLEPWWSEATSCCDGVLLTRWDAAVWALRHHRGIVTEEYGEATADAIIAAAVDAWEVLLRIPTSAGRQAVATAACVSLPGDHRRIGVVFRLATAVAERAAACRLLLPAEVVRRAHAAWAEDEIPAAWMWAPGHLQPQPFAQPGPASHPAAGHTVYRDVLHAARTIATITNGAPTAVLLGRATQRSGWLLDALARCGVTAAGIVTTPWLATSPGAACAALVRWRAQPTWGAACDLLAARAACSDDPSDQPPVPLDRITDPWRHAAPAAALEALLACAPGAAGDERLRWAWRHAATPGVVAAWMSQQIQRLGGTDLTWGEHLEHLGITASYSLRGIGDLSRDDALALLTATTSTQIRGSWTDPCVLAPLDPCWLGGRIPIVLPHLGDTPPMGYLRPLERQALGWGGDDAAEALAYASAEPAWHLLVPTAAAGVPGPVLACLQDGRQGPEVAVHPVRGAAPAEDLGELEAQARARPPVAATTQIAIPASLPLAWTPDSLGMAWRDAWWSVLEHLDVGPILTGTHARDDGSDLHAILQRLVAVPPAEWATAAECELAAWIAAGDDPWERLLRRRRAPEIAAAIVAEGDLLRDGRTPVPESTVAITLDIPGHGPLALRGRMDRVDRLANGRYWVVDYKRGSGEEQRRSLVAGTDAQVLTYLYGLRQAGRVVAGGHYRGLATGSTCGYLDVASPAPLPGRGTYVDTAQIDTLVARLGTHLAQVLDGVCPLDLSEDAPSRRYLPIARSDDLRLLADLAAP